MKKIAIIIPYYGHFGSIMEFWIKSISNNPSIDFLLFTDLSINNKPQNLLTINLTFNELINLAQKNFEFKICAPDPYKFIDFRPAYGEIFSKYLKEYDFWGFCDTDLIFGDIRKFITDSLLDQYDKILAQGHFTLYKNTPEVNSIYKNCKEPYYKQVFTFPLNCAFDEYYGTSGYWAKYLTDRFYRKILFDDLDCYKYEFTPLFKKNIGKYYIYSYENGKLFRIYELNHKIHKEETMYVHFQKRKMKLATSPSNYFLMIPNVFIAYNNNINIDTLHHLYSNKKWYPHKYKLYIKRLLNKLKKVHASLSPKEFGNPTISKNGYIYYQHKE